MKIEATETIIKTWETRSLTLYGKVVVIKSIVMSKITHLLLALLCPSKQLLQSIDNLVANRPWNEKTPRFRREIIKADIKEGGMKLQNLH